MQGTATYQDVTITSAHQPSSCPRLTWALLPGPHCSVQMQHAADEQVLVADNDWHDDLSCMYLSHHELESV